MYSIGSSYLIQQSPSSERFGGVTIKLWRSQSDEPVRQVVFTDWKQEQPIADDIKTLAVAAEKTSGLLNDFLVNENENEVTIDQSIRTKALEVMRQIRSELRMED